MFFHSCLTALRPYELFKYRAVYKYILLLLFKLKYYKGPTKQVIHLCGFKRQQTSQTN